MKCHKLLEIIAFFTKEILILSKAYKLPLIVMANSRVDMEYDFLELYQSEELPGRHKRPKPLCRGHASLTPPLR